MDVRWKLFFFCLTISANVFAAKNFNQCLQETQNLHRLERDDQTLECFKKYKAFLGSDNCFAHVRNLKAAQQSAILNENLRNICFYEASIFQNMKTCMIRAEEFKNAENHDEAIFQCFKQFQDKVSKADCFKTSEKFRYPAKKEHLLQYCYNNY